MRIAIDASRTTRERLTGTESYALHLIRALIRHNDTLDAPHTLTLYFRDEPPPGLFPASEHVQHKIVNMRRLWSQVGLMLALWRDRPDVTWVPAHGLPFFMPGKAAVTVHDLGYKRFPAAHTWRQRLALEVYTRFSAWRAKIVLADSRATQRDLTRYTGTPAEKVRVVYPGVSVPLVGDIDTARATYNLPARYWLFVGTLQPRKNIARIVGAYQMWLMNTEDTDTALVLAGGRGWQFDERWVTGEGVVLTGYIDEAEKGALMANALALVFPSLYEGFGFPVVEAMSLGTPVICSNTSSLPELAGEAAAYVQPDNVMMLADRMQVISANPDLRAEMVKRGKVQAAQFTWERAAEDALAAIVEAGKPSPPGPLSHKGRGGESRDEAGLVRQPHTRP